MKITKYVHSCLLIETPERVGIIDPGIYSWESGLLKIDDLVQLDDIIITHEHADHFHPPFVQALLAKFPNARITASSATAEQLAAEGVNSFSTESSEGIDLADVSHESMVPLAPPPKANLIVHYLDRLTHPGDSHNFDETREILALPLTAPWGSLRRAAELGLELKPKTIIPIHDWHLNDIARVQAHERLEGFFKEHGINFVKLIDGESKDFK